MAIHSYRSYQSDDRHEFFLLFRCEYFVARQHCAIDAEYPTEVSLLSSLSQQSRDRGRDFRVEAFEKDIILINNLFQL